MPPADRKTVIETLQQLNLQDDVSSTEVCVESGENVEQSLHLPMGNNLAPVESQVSGDLELLVGKTGMIFIAFLIKLQ